MFTSRVDALMEVIIEENGEATIIMTEITIEASNFAVMVMKEMTNEVDAMLDATLATVKPVTVGIMLTATTAALMEV